MRAVVTIPGVVDIISPPAVTVWLVTVAENPEKACAIGSASVPLSTNPRPPELIKVSIDVLPGRVATVGL